MAKIKTAEEAAHNYIRGVLQAFLEGKQNLQWLLKVIEGVSDTTLAEIFESLREYGSRQRYEEAVLACRQRGWLP